MVADTKKMLTGRYISKNKKAKIMFVADTPTKGEYKLGKYMIGNVAKLLLNAMKTVKINPNDCYFTAIVKYAMDDEEEEPTRKDIDLCYPLLKQEIEDVNPQIIVPMGNVSLKKLYGYTGITKYRGKGILDEGRIIFPILHPTLIFNQPKYSKKWVTDMHILKRLVDEGENYFERKSVNYRYLETIEEVEKEIKRLNHAKMVCYDLETTGLNPFEKDSRIVCISLTDRTHYGVTIPFEHNDFKWRNGELPRVIALVKGLLENKKVGKIAYHGKFDSKWLLVKHGIDVKPFKFDPMLAHYLCVSEERGGHSLKNLSWEYTDMGNYEAPLEEYKDTLPKEIKNNYYYISWDILREYASADVDCTFRLYLIFKDILKNNKKWKYVFKNILMRGSDLLRDIEINGAYMDTERLKLYEEVYPKRITEIEAQLRKYPEVVMIEREKRELYKLRQLEMKKPKDERNPEIMKYNKFKNFQFNFGSTQNLRELLFVKLGLETPFLTKKGEERKRKFEQTNRLMGGKEKFVPDLDELSTGKDTLDYLADKHPITKLLAEWRKLEKLYGTYIVPARNWLDENNIVHSTYMQHATVTGRLASESPNAQNFPAKSNVPSDFDYEYGIKKLFTSRFGDEGIMLQFDYSQLEIRVAVMFSNDKNLQKAYNDGLDIHRYSSSKALNVPYDEVTADQRQSAKAIRL